MNTRDEGRRERSAAAREANLTPSVPPSVDGGGEGRRPGERFSSGGLHLADNARVVLERRYLAKDAEGNVVETPEQLFRRVANNIAQAERLYLDADAPADEYVAAATGRFYALMTSLRFLPNSPTLGNAGRKLQQLSACFVLPVEDSMASIFETVKETALIHQSGGGTGFAFSRLRPAGDMVQTTGGVASGPVSFMRVFDAATEAIKQGGTRRGANMAILDVRHPDIEAFINVKADMVTLTNFNISVAVDDAFMRAVEAGEEYELINPRTGAVAGRRNARAVFDQIVANAWQNGDPGLVFLDRINRDNPTPALGQIEATNPCGEQPLLPYESCNLGSINLARFAKEPPGAASSNVDESIDWGLLAETVTTAVRFLDNVIDMNAYPVPAIDRMTKLTRKIGLGVMGWADLLYELGVPYDSEAAIELAGRVMSFIRERADAASESLAAERSVFPSWQASIFGPEAPEYRGLKPTASSDSAPGGAESGDGQSAHPEALEGRGAISPADAASDSPSPSTERGPGGEVGPPDAAGSSPRSTPIRRFRNSTRTTIAPTGTLSIIADCSGGIEPAFALAFTRQHYLDPKQPTQPVRLTEVNGVFASAARAGGFYSAELVEFLAAGGSLHDRPEVPDDAKRTFVTAHDIAPEWHVRMQAAFQRHTDNAVSKTINFPRAAAAADVAAAYLLAYREGCKGITIYRDGSRAGQVLTYVADGESGVASDFLGALEASVAGLTAAGEPLHRRRLADERQSLTHKFRVGEQEGYVTVGLYEDGAPGEIFVTISKEGSTIRGLMDSVAMLTSYALQYGVPLRTLVDKFRGVHFEPAGFTANPSIPQASSIVDYIFRWLEVRFLGGDPAHPEARKGDAPAHPEALEGGAAASLVLEPSRDETRRRPGSRARRSPTRASSGYMPPRPGLPLKGEIETGLVCPDCGTQLIFSEGCLICRSCGYTKCG